MTRPVLSLALPLLFCGCGGPGFDGYRELYPDPDGGEPGAPWAGTESVLLVRAGEQREVLLAGLPTVALEGAAAVGLAQVVEAAALTDHPAGHRFNFTASDGYDLLRKRNDDLTLLPRWAELQIGVLYRHPAGDLRVTWDRERQPWGSALSAYLVKAMDGGTITLLPSD